MITNSALRDDVAPLTLKHASLISEDMQRGLRDLADRLASVTVSCDSTEALFLGEQTTRLLELAEMFAKGTFSMILHAAAERSVDVDVHRQVLDIATRHQVISILALASNGEDTTNEGHSAIGFRAIRIASKQLLNVPNALALEGESYA